MSKKLIGLDNVPYSCPECGPTDEGFEVVRGKHVGAVGSVRRSISAPFKFDDGVHDEPMFFEEHVRCIQCGAVYDLKNDGIAITTVGG